jgi:hypothetical protein
MPAPEPIPDLLKAVNEASGKAFALWITFLTVDAELHNPAHQLIGARVASSEPARVSAWRFFGAGTTCCFSQVSSVRGGEQLWQQVKDTARLYH